MMTLVTVNSCLKIGEKLHLVAILKKVLVYNQWIQGFNRERMNIWEIAENDIARFASRELVRRNLLSAICESNNQGTDCKAMTF
jgi:hypothetical protein